MVGQPVSENNTTGRAARSTSIITTPPSRNRSEFLDETDTTAVGSFTQPTLVCWRWIGEGHAGANV